jgi:pimeloyl-ACP methyl ester carboxylesterase
VPKVEVNGVELAYQESGSGPPVLLIHGSWGGRANWAAQTPHLEDGLRVVIYDRRGHGESGGTPEAGTIHDDVADAAGLIEALDMAPANVMASSYGSCIALRLASERPELVTRLVCHEPPFLSALESSSAGRPIAESVLTNLAEVRRRLEAGDHAGGAEYFVEEVAVGPGAWTQLPPPVRDGFLLNAPTYLGELRDPDSVRVDPAVLGRIQAPLLLTQGDRSPAWFAPLLDHLVEALPPVERRVIEGAGHVPAMSHPQEYASVVREFFGRS